MRFFMGVGKYTPNLALYGDMGGMPCIVKQWTCIFRTYSRFTKMCDDRINKKVFIWANNICNNRLKNWNFRVHTKFKELDMEHFCNTNLIIDKHVIKNIENICFNRFKEQ